MSSAISKVTYYYAEPVRTCDMCGAGIHNVFKVEYKDGIIELYGPKCINKILAHTPDLKTLFNKNAKKLRKYEEWKEILTGPIDDIPIGSEYYGSGLYFIGDKEGKEISIGGSGWLFHPYIDEEKNQNGNNYVVKDFEKREAEVMGEIDSAIRWLDSEINRISSFLARVLNKANQVS